MPITVPNDLPATQILRSENIHIMQEMRAKTQDIRPLQILILNLMPNKIQTETQLLRLLGNTPIQIEIELLQTASHISKNTSADHLWRFYNTFDNIKHRKFDGLIITGAPIEQMPFEEVDYWKELCEIFEWAKKNVYSCFNICWGAQAALYYYHDIPKHSLPSKMFGVFHHILHVENHPLIQGFDQYFNAPHSRHTTVYPEDILKCDDLDLISSSPEAGVYIVADKKLRNFFVTGHSEYDIDSLANEYFRDKNAGLPISIPKNYFPNDDSSQTPIITWRSHANLLFSNWINYIVYPQTPYDLSKLSVID